MRNLDNAISEGHAIAKEHPQATASMKELNVFYDRLAAGGDTFAVLNDLFSFGVAVGSRIEKGKQKGR